MNIFIDTSSYFALLNPFDASHQKAIEEFSNCVDMTQYTSQAVIGELLTVGSMKFDKKKTVEFVQGLMETNLHILTEEKDVFSETMSLFNEIQSKNVSWVDCSSIVFMKKYDIKNILGFDRHLRTLQELYIK